MVESGRLAQPPRACGVAARGGVRLACAHAFATGERHREQGESRSQLRSHEAVLSAAVWSLERVRFVSGLSSKGASPFQSGTARV